MKALTLLMIAGVLAVACSETGAPLVASDVVIKRPMPGMEMSAGYLTLTNNSKSPITVTHVTSPQLASVEVHETMVEDGISRMVRLGELVIPPSASLVFEPGAKHLMLMRPTGELDSVTLSIHSGDTVLLTIDATPEG